MDEIILALDASSTNVGWCIAQSERYIDSGTFKPRGNRDERLVEIVRWFEEIVQRHHPDVVAIEKPTGHHRNLDTDRLLARVCGAIEGAAILLDLPVFWAHPMTVKATGFCKNNPPAAALLVRKSRVGPDEADAIGIWQVALGRLQAQRLEDLVRIAR